MTKIYDRAYYDRWYRDPRHRVRTRADLERTVRCVLGIAEHLLGRPVRSVLDVGCGEGRWQPVLQRLRPGSRYAGLDTSEYAVARWGRRRNIRLGGFDALDEAGLEEAYDLVVCADVLHYLPTRALRRGLAALPAYVGGVAYLETYAADDGIVGDLAGFQRRRSATYLRLFREAGLVPLALHCYVTAEGADELTTLERPA